MTNPLSYNLATFCFQKAEYQGGSTLAPEFGGLITIVKTWCVLVDSNIFLKSNIVFLILWKFHAVYFKHMFLLPQSFPRSSPIPTHPNSWPFSLFKKKWRRKATAQHRDWFVLAAYSWVTQLALGCSWYTSWLRSGVVVKFNILTFGWAKPSCSNTLAIAS